MTLLGLDAALATAQRHRETAASPELRRYWDQVIASIRRRPR